jgi:hypothetical protein
MEYLIHELLRPGDRAAANRDPRLAGFTFDHRLDGLIVGERSWSRKLFAIRVADDMVSEEVLLKESHWLGSPDGTVSTRRTDPGWRASHALAAPASMTRRRS